ncbi:MAG: helix-turn-helix transcriptional regulator [Firmicutes bacterium]|nr:helix-turn-helix transcriptional regulator [Bacillota bacterium]MBR3706466.1 helix-turn-helix transcriptional regulator [Bacillota bacterium]
MIDMNIKFFRKKAEITQEQLAERLCVSRQTLAKWENGEAAPNIEDCIRLAGIFQISLDDLVRDMSEQELILTSPRGKHFFGVVTVGERGQIVIPKDARKLFDINAGDKLVVLGEDNQGIAIVKADNFESFAKTLLEALKNTEGI